MTDGRENKTRSLLDGIRPDRRRFLQTAIGAIGVASIATSVSESVQATENQEAGEDWPMVGYDAANTGYLPEGDGPTSLGEVWTFETDFEINSSPVVSDGTVYIGSEDRSLYAIDQMLGELNWQKDFEESVGRESVVIMNDSIFVAPNNDHIYALDQTTGDEIWSESVNSTWLLTADDGVVYHGSTVSVVARDANDGEELWSFSTGSGTPIFDSPAVVDGSLYFAFSEEVYSLDIEDGSEEWVFRTFDTVWGDPTVVNDTVYVGSSDENLYAIDAANGEKSWRYNVDSRIQVSPVVTDEAVYIASWDKMTAIDKRDGTLIWEVELSGTTRSSPAIVGDIIYFGSGDEVLALDVDSGQEISSFEKPDLIRFSSPAISSNTVYIGCTDGALYALSESEFEATLIEIPEEIISGESLHIEFEIENTAAGLDTQVVTGAVNDEVVWRNDIELSENETYEDSFDYETDGTDIPTISVSVASDDDEASAEIAVVEAEEDEDDTEAQEDDTATNEDIPGFGVGGAIASLGGAAYLLKRRLSGQDTDE